MMKNFLPLSAISHQADIPLVSAKTVRELDKDGGTPYLLSIKQRTQQNLHLLSLIQKLSPYFSIVAIG